MLKGMYGNRLGVLQLWYRSGRGQGKVSEIHFESGKFEILKKGQGKLK